MRIYLVRHSLPDDDGEDLSDDEREDKSLTPEGIKIVKTLAKWMAEKDEVPTILYASPSVRTQETAELLKDDLGVSDIITDVTIGPATSVRGLVLRLARNDAIMRPGIVSHHESISNGMRELNGEPWPHLDRMAMGELRIVKVKRKSGKWDEHRRVLPSKLNGIDHY